MISTLKKKKKVVKKDDNLKIIPECHSARQRQRKSLYSDWKLSRLDRNGVEIYCCSLKSYVIPFTSIISWRYQQSFPLLEFLTFQGKKQSPRNLINGFHISSKQLQSGQEDRTHYKSPLMAQWPNKVHSSTFSSKHVVVIFLVKMNEPWASNAWFQIL